MSTVSTESRSEAALPPVLALRGVSAGYGQAPVIESIDIEVRPGEVVAILGPNGAGKTTTLLSLAGFLKTREGEVLSDGEATKAALHRRCRSGLAFVTEERSVIASMSVRDNLRVGRCDTKLATSLFPELEPLMGRRAGLLSGGEQQMLTLARALARRPKVLLADELSLGLAPLVVKRLLAAVRSAADDGLAVVLVEQHVRKALEVADRVYVLRQGRVQLSGTAAEARDNLQAIEDVYLSRS
jgi:branched-chain amino acid transport system ATP-binding protein